MEGSLGSNNIGTLSSNKTENLGSNNKGNLGSKGHITPVYKHCMKQTQVGEVCGIYSFPP